MTFAEYIEKNYPSLHELIESTNDYSELYQILFPNYASVKDELTSLNYTPFVYVNNPTLIDYSGGRIVLDISQYIGENYYEHGINKRYTKIIGQYSSLKNKIKMLMYRYKYKWHYLYESTQLDSQYDPLDNVNEIYDETITRTPDLTYTDANSNTFGQKTTTNTNQYGAQSVDTENVFGTQSTNTEMVHGAQSIDTEMVYGSISESENTLIGGREDIKENEYGSHTDTDTTSNTVNPYDDQISSYVSTGSTTNMTRGNYIDTETTNTGQQTNTVSKSTLAHTDTQSVDSASYTDTQSVDSASYTDTQSVDSASYTDTLTGVESQHVDSFSGTKTETGEEETVITRRRHGNIGVTTSGQLIEDFRKTHYFDLVAIMSNDIINEIFDMNFES